MTRSTEQHARCGKAGRAVTAALVGVLSVSAPVVALAAGTGQADAAGDVALMVATPAELFSEGSLAAAKTNNSDEVDIIEGKPLQIAMTPGEPTYLIPTQVLPSGPDSKPVNVTSDEFMVTYWTDKECEKYPIADLEGANWYPGTYYVKIAAVEGAYKGGELVVEFTVTPASLEGATLIDCGPVGGGELTATTFTYNGSAQHVGVALNGAKLDEDKYAFTFKVAGTDTIVQPENLVDAGTYDVYVAGREDYEGSLEVVQLTVGSLDLSTADVALADTESNVNVVYAESNLTIDGVYNELLTEDSNKLKITPKSGPSDDGTKLGTYVFAIEPAAGVTKNIVGSATVSASKVSALVDDHEYRFMSGDTALGDSVTVDLSKGESFDLKSIHVVDAEGKEVVANDAVEVTIADEDGRVLDMTGKVSTPGTYVVTYRVDAEKTDYKFGSGEYALDLTVIAGAVENSDAILYFDGEIATEKEVVTYAARDYLELLDPHVTCGEKILVEGEDYSIAVTRGGVACDGIVSAGTYQVSLVSDSYDFSEVTGIQITVEPFDLESESVKVTFDGATKAVVDGKVIEVLPYTGKGYEPRVLVAFTSDEDGGEVWTELSPQDYTATTLYSKTSSTELAETDKGVCEAGYYAINVAANSEATNFEGGTTVYREEYDSVAAPFIVTTDKAFIDVPASEWYADAVAISVDQGYITGVDNGNTFAPATSLNRAEFVTILYRMAGGDSAPDGTPHDTGFPDVEPSAWYAKALDWAVKNNIVTGYEDGTFGGGDKIQTEQMVTMLGRYAKLKGDYTAVADVEGTLSAVADGGSVSAFAREYVAWGIQKELICRDGALIDPQGNIARGRTMTIAVRYQPVQATIIK